MEPLVTNEELSRIEALPLAERVAALEEIERRLRSVLEDESPA